MKKKIILSKNFQKSFFVKIVKFLIVKFVESFVDFVKICAKHVVIISKSLAFFIKIIIFFFIFKIIFGIPSIIQFPLFVSRPVTFIYFALLKGWHARIPDTVSDR